MPGTVHELLIDRAALSPGGTALVDDSASLTWAGWLDLSRAAARALSDAGVAPGDTVGVLCGKNVMLPVAFTAVSMTGARFMALSRDWPAATASRLHPRTPGDRTLCLDGDPGRWGGSSCIMLDPDRLIGTGSAWPPADVDPGLPFYLNVTSASTGMPKIAPVSHSALLANTAGVSAALGMTGGDVLLSLFSASGHPHELFMRPLLLGGISVLTESRYPRTALDLMERTGVTVLMGLPPQLDGLARMMGRGGARPAALRLAESGGMHSSAEMIARFSDLSGVPLVPVWGSTETSGVALVGTPGREGLDRVVDGYGILLADPDGKPVTEGQGELWVRGPAVVDGYLGERGGGFEDGWFRSGDIFGLRGGTLHFTGRRGGLIKASGMKVYPLEVELAILRHPEILDAAVYATDARGRGETVAASVIPRPGRSPSPQELRAFLRSMLEENKIPRVIEIVSDLPRTPSGKLDRSRLGEPQGAPDLKGEILRTDVELVRLLCHRARLAEGLPFDPGWVEEQLESAAGHNPGPLSDDTVRRLLSAVIELTTGRMR